MKKIILPFALALIFLGCATSTQIAPNLDEDSANSYQISAKFVSQKEYMKKYLPQNVVLNENSNISVSYEFSDNHEAKSWDRANAPLAEIGLFNPLILVGFPNGINTLSLAGNLKFSDGINEVKFSAICVSDKQRSLFLGADFGELRKICAQKLAQNLEKQINLSYEKGEFNVFR